MDFDDFEEDQQQQQLGQDQQEEHQDNMRRMGTTSTGENNVTDRRYLAQNAEDERAIISAIDGVGVAAALDDDFDSNISSQFNNGTEPQEGHCFEVVKHDAREIHQIVKAMAFREYCTMVVNSEGIRLVVDDQHNQQASAYFKYEQFSDYTLRAVICNLRIPLNVFMETLNMFTSNTAVLKMWYEGEGYPLMVSMEDEGIVVQAAIKTLNLQSMLDFEFINSSVISKAILNPSPMREILRDLDMSAETIVITFTPAYLSFYTVGALGKIKVEIPATSEHLEHLSCKNDRVCFQYRIVLIKRLAECVRLCNKVSLRVDERGVLSVQLLIPQSEQVVFAEFYCTADDDAYHPDTS